MENLVCVDHYKFAMHLKEKGKTFPVHQDVLKRKKLLRWQFVFIASVEHGRPGFSFISWIIYAHQPLFHGQYLIALKHKELISLSHGSNPMHLAGLADVVTTTC